MQTTKLNEPGELFKKSEIGRISSILPTKPVVLQDWRVACQRNKWVSGFFGFFVGGRGGMHKCIFVMYKEGLKEAFIWFF